MAIRIKCRSIFDPFIMATMRECGVDVIYRVPRGFIDSQRTSVELPP